MKVLVIAAFFVISSFASAAEHYCVLFSHNGRKSKPGESHTFATFVEVSNGKLTQQYTISWGPIGEWKIFDGKVPGHNRSLKTSIEVPLSKDWQVCMWGPYKMTPSYFEKAKQRYKDLHDGLYSYKAIDSRARKNEQKPGVNCIHAVSDIGGFIKTEGHYGDSATGIVAEAWKDRKICEPYMKENDKILKPLELDRYSKIVRKY
jgi:hypothetical protein